MKFKPIFFFIICLLSTVYGCSQGKLQFTRLNMLTAVDTIDSKVVNRSDYVIVKNYSTTKENDRAIDSYVTGNFKDISKNYSDYQVVLYKESAETTESAIKEDKRVIDRYSQDHDLIYIYFWMNGKFIEKRRVRDGVMEGSEKIKVEDVNN
jgi:hypothetical protein